ncbi:hypothetical protein CCHR01_03221 [Colletotrichum chrysophilum]|uniref:Uncharacterized protein n=1 Tax=Colletotrichum chrysophilum TaxID=1836956 RepID=A0AAD9ATB6_9PEZI|nr:hypothetical protein K456DRAFT_618478 [Colletotrichum gloeosporioides 23]KAK1854138.1 hypothetical protein CCHR01_03221 [Colletotrichum chrysophilum]
MYRLFPALPEFRQVRYGRGPWPCPGGHNQAFSPVRTTGSRIFLLVTCTLASYQGLPRAEGLAQTAPLGSKLAPCRLWSSRSNVDWPRSFRSEVRQSGSASPFAGVFLPFPPSKFQAGAQRSVGSHEKFDGCFHAGGKKRP